MISAIPSISICIPAYKRIDFLKRLLHSIDVQEYRDFEVIVTDDSPDKSVEALCKEYSSKFLLRYYRNQVTLGTPENWNEGIRMARGRWIKLMHDDDWFSAPGALGTFANVALSNSEADFIFSAYSNHYSDSGKIEQVKANWVRMWLLRKHPASLFSKNIIGPPSVTLHKNDSRFFYDKSIKWVVDIDFYIRYFDQCQPIYIPKSLINVGLGSHQVTMDCVRQRTVEIPENLYLLNKIGFGVLKKLSVFDAFWRLMRNLEITSVNDIREAGYSGPIPNAISCIITRQQQLGLASIRKGLYSKFFMFGTYLSLKLRDPNAFNSDC